MVRYILLHMYIGDNKLLSAQNKKQQRLKTLTLIAVFGCMLSAFKFMLSTLPNIEVVTLLIMVIACVCGGGISVAATLVFCTIELALFGFAPHALCYFLHWPFVALATYLCRNRLKTEIGYAALAFSVTVLFGIQTSITYVALSGGLQQISTFWHKVGLVYLNGIVFYIVHIAGNTLGVLFLFTPLKSVVQKHYSKYMS